MSPPAERVNIPSQSNYPAHAGVAVGVAGLMQGVAEAEIERRIELVQGGTEPLTTAH